MSNLPKLDGAEHTIFSAVFQGLITLADERFNASRKVAAHPVFARSGLSDAAIAMATRQDLLVLTDDFQLYAALATNGADCINFSHLRVL